jgi:hypothetical protein
MLQVARFFQRVGGVLMTIKLLEMDGECGK